MDLVTAPKPAPEFIFRGNAMASGGYLTVLDGKPARTLNPDEVTVHGESSIPGIGGISQSTIDQPKLAFHPWIQYGRCETHVEGTGDNGSKVTTLLASVKGVSVTTRPSQEDNLPKIKEISFQAARLSLNVRSVHPLEKQPYFFLLTPPIAEGLTLTVTPRQGVPKKMAVELEFEHPLVSGCTMDEFDRQFVADETFYKQFAPRLQTKVAVKFGDKPPRSQGYVFTSIVKGFKVDGKHYDGFEHVEQGFGKITFGRMIADGYSRRVILVSVKMGSDPDGFSSHAAIDTNGVWN